MRCKKACQSSAGGARSNNQEIRLDSVPFHRDPSHTAFPSKSDEFEQMTRNSTFETLNMI